MSSRTVIAVVVTVALATASFGAVSLASGASADADCSAVEDRQVCLQEFSAPETLLIDGENGTVSITAENVGSVEAGVLVVLNTRDPNNETSSFALAEETLAPGESTTVTQPLNATTPGTHGLRAVLVDTSTNRQYDTSESVFLDVRSEPAPGLGGPIDRTEIALVAFLAAIVGMVALGMRLRR
jgi:hypothetical protein